MKQKVFIFIILSISILLRIYKLGDVPLSPDWDEAALGYNAYSILNTAKDEYNEFLPVILRSFNDYKPALYSYLIIPFLIILDLNVLSVRLPSVIFGIIGIIALYFLIKELFSNGSEHKMAFSIALISVFFLAISPWHLQFSRVAFESNVGLTFNILFALFFIKGLKKPIFFTPSFIFAALSIYTYQSEKVFVPLMLIGMSLIYFKEINKGVKKYYIFALFVFFLILTPMLYQIYANPESLSRAKGVSVFSNQTALLEKSTERLNIAAKNNDYLGLLFNNRRIVYAKVVVANYLSHFDPVWLFITGDLKNNRHQPPHMGLVYIVQLPLILIGIYQLTFGDYKSKTKLFIFFWLISSPIPASVTNEVPHAVRTLNMVPMIQLIAALGLLALMQNKFQIGEKFYNLKYLFLIILTPLMIINVAYYLNQYFIQQNYKYALDWQYGYKEMVNYLESEKINYEKLAISNRGIMDQSYIFFLFYTKHDPEIYLKNGGSLHSKYPQGIIKFDKYEFRSYDINKEKDSDKKTLFIGSDIDLTNNLNVVYEILYPNGQTAIKAAKK